MTASDPGPGSYYESLGGGRYRATEHTEGAWQSIEQHMAPVSGLLAQAVENVSGRDDLVTSRIAFDILGMIARTEVTVTAEVIRPGRTIELVQAEMVADGRPVVRATAWRLATTDTSAFAASEFSPMPGPDQAQPYEGSTTWGGRFIAELDWRVLPGWRPGRGRGWVRTPIALLDDGEVGPLARFVGLVDTANGVAVRVPPDRMLFPNTDLTIHLTRTPRGEWVGLDTSVSFGAGGVGVTTSVLHDVDGPVGVAAQTLTLRPR